jgi:hypothetical protein
MRTEVRGPRPPQSTKRRGSMFQYGLINGIWRVWFLDGKKKDFLGTFREEEVAKATAKSLAENVFPMLSNRQWGKATD